MKLNKGDFVELNYTGRLTEDNIVFDTTIQKIAEDAGLLHKHEPGHNHDHSDQYRPIVVCVGENHVLPGLDKKIEGLELGNHKILLKEVEAFGKKDAKLITMIPMSTFKKQEIRPFVGLDLNIDGKIGVVRSVGGGRVLVDFNHPLAGRDLTYDIELKRIVSDNNEKITAMLDMSRLPNKGVNIVENKAKVSLDREIPDVYLNMVSEDIKRLTGLEVEYIKPQAKDTKENNVKDIKENNAKENLKDNKESKATKAKEQKNTPKSE